MTIRSKWALVPGFVVLTSLAAIVSAYTGARQQQPATPAPATSAQGPATRPSARATNKAPDTVITNRHAQRPEHLFNLHTHERGTRVFDRVREHLGDDVVACRLDTLPEAFRCENFKVHRNRRAAGQYVQGRPEPAFRQDRGVDPAGDLAQLVKRGRHRVLLSAKDAAGNQRHVLVTFKVKAKKTKRQTSR